MSKNPLDKDIDRPLGLGARKPDRQGPHLPRRGQVVLAMAGLCIVAVAGFVAFDKQPLRTPPQVVVSTPDAASAPTESALPPARTSTSAYPERTDNTGPSIIKVEQGDAPASSVIIVRDPSSLGQDLRVAHLPDRALIEDSEGGPLPVRAADGRRPFDVYARPWSGTRGARVAIVIGGLGVSQTGTQTAISRLPPEVTLAFASGGNSLDRWMQSARQAGHEIVMQVPLEPFDYPQVDPGRNTLTVDAQPAENRDRLYWALSRITNYTGVMNYMGARFVTDDAAMQPFFTELAKRGLMYLDDGSSARSIAPDMAAKTGLPYAAADMAIDTERERGAILKKLDDLERTARAKGFAVGTGSAFDVTVDAVATWIQEAKRRGIEIVPISAIATDPEKG
ncbi:divergent polysaccharide deacetylase family protein [Mesorhizobium sp. CAU 1732]|uniref:divergent polysaccharide deacetylase family protein n=1 Tax=Mesorhizobium sp. CAU 1732 TaxID=3140358 RepID=UPI003261BEB7